MGLGTGVTAAAGAETETREDVRCKVAAAGDGVGAGACSTPASLAGDWAALGSPVVSSCRGAGIGGVSVIGEETSITLLLRRVGAAGAGGSSAPRPSAAFISAIEGVGEAAASETAVRWMRSFIRAYHSSLPKTMCAGAGAGSSDWSSVSGSARAVSASATCTGVVAPGAVEGSAATTRATCRCERRLCSEESKSAFRAMMPRPARPLPPKGTSFAAP